MSLGANHDHGASAVIDPFAQQVLAKAPLLAPKQVRKALELVVVAALDWASPAAVVDQGVDRLLEHPLLISNDDFGSTQGHQPLEPVVPVDDPAIQVVQVAGGEAAAVKLHHWPQFGGQHRHDGEDHVLHACTVSLAAVAAVAALAECFHHAQALYCFLPPLPGGGLHVVDQLVSQGFQVHGAEDGQDGLRAHARLEDTGVPVLEFPVAGLGQQLHLLQVVQLVQGHLQLGVQLGFLGGQLVVYGIDLPLDFQQFGDRLSALGGELGGRVLGRRFLAAGVAEDQAIQFLKLIGGICASPFDFQLVLQLFRFHGLAALLVVHRYNDVLGEVENPLEVAWRKVEQQAQPAGVGLAEPDVGHGRRQADVPHALPAHLGAGYLHAAAVADHAPVANALVLSAEALPVLGGAEQPFTEQAVLFRAEGPVVDGFRLGDLAVRPAEDLLRRGYGDAYGIEVRGRGVCPVCHSYHY